MALNINGTTGISGVDGSASAPALQGTDSNTGINFGSDTVNINTGGTTRATFDSNGRLGLGTTSPDSAIGIIGTGSDAATRINFTDGSGKANINGRYGNLSFQVDTDDAVSGSLMQFITDGTEMMRIQNTGTVAIGKPTGHGNGGVPGIELHSTNHYIMGIRDGGTAMFLGRNTSTGTLINFIYSANSIGQISTNGSSTTYATSSDYRLKENVTAISDGITRLKTLKPYRFNFKADSSTVVDGFLAHEVTAVPEAITGTKDETYKEDDDKIGVKAGDPKYQSIDQSKLVPLLTAALQEAVAKIEVLETKVAALEAG